MVTTTLRKLLGVAVGFLILIKLSLDTVEYDMQIMEIEESVQPKRVPPNSGGEGGGGTPLDPPILVDVVHFQKLGPYF